MVDGTSWVDFWVSLIVKLVFFLRHAAASQLSQQSSCDRDRTAGVAQRNYYLVLYRASLVAQSVKNPSAMQETRV